MIISIIILAHSANLVEAQQSKILVVKLETEITAATTTMLKDAMEIAGNVKARLVVIEVNTPGGEINAVKKIMDIFETSSIPVCVFVYPLGASAWSGGTYLLMSAHIAAMASGTSVGSAQPVFSTGELITDSKRINALSTLMMNHAQLHDRNGTAAHSFVVDNLNLGPQEALRYHVIEVIADDLSTLLKKLSEKTLIKVESKTGASVWKLVKSEELPLYTPVVKLPFSGLDKAELIEYEPAIQMGFLQVLFNPLVASLMFTLGFFLVLVGIQTPGLGAEFLGALLLLFSLMSLQVIGVEPTMFLLFIVGFALIIGELMTNIGFLGIAGLICITLGSFLLFPSPHWLLAPEVSRRIRKSLVATSIILSIFFGILAYKVAQSRKLKIKTGSEMVEGSIGVVTTKLDPTGVVRVGGVFWRARAEKGSIDRGTDVVVVGREGLLFIVRAVNPTASTQNESQSREGE
jgi:membrane-bound serine protease (ClpP class)